MHTGRDQPLVLRARTRVAAMLIRRDLCHIGALAQWAGRFPAATLNGGASRR